MLSQMLENCNNLYKSEKIFSKNLENKSLIGELPLTNTDLKKLEQLLKVYKSENNIIYIINHYPNSIAIYLVWKGIIAYDGGDYWDSIKQGLKFNSINKQQSLGRFFRKYINQNKFYEVELPKAKPFITPILFQGVLPNTCLNEFFNDLVSRLHRILSCDEIDENEIEHEINVQRRRFKQRLDIKQRISQLRKNKKNYQNKINKTRAKINIRKNVEKFKSLKLADRDINLIKELPVNYKKFKKDIHKRLKNFQRQREKLENIKKEKLTNISRHKYNNKHLEYSSLIQKIGYLKKHFVGCIKKTTEINKYKERINAEIKELESILFTKENVNYNRKSIFRIEIDSVKKLIKEIYVLQNEFKSLSDKLQKGYYQKINPAILLVHSISLIIFILLGIYYSFSPLSFLVIFVLLNIDLITWRLIREKNNYPKKEDFLSPIQKEITRKNNKLRAKLPNFIRSCFYKENLSKLPKLLKKLKSLYRIKQLINFKIILNKIKLNKIQIQVRQKFDPFYDRNELNRIFQNNFSNSSKIDTEKIEQFKKTINYINNKLDPKISHMAEKITKTNKFLTNVNKRISKLGEGDFNDGLDKLNKIRKQYEEYKNLHDQINNLKTRYDLNGENDIGKNSILYLQEKITNLEQNLSEAKSHIQEEEKRLNSINTILNNLSKPIIRFFVYGNQIANNYVINATKLINKLSGNDTISNNIDVDLPPRFIEYGLEWWDRQQKIENNNRNMEYSHPYIYFSPTNQKIRLHCPDQKLKHDEFTNNEYLLLIKDSHQDKLIKKVKLNSYKNYDNSIRTESYELEIENLVQEFTVIMLSNNSKIAKWSINFNNRNRVFLFHPNTNKLIKNNKAPKPETWLIAYKTYKINKNIHILEQGSILGGLDLKYYLIDTKDLQKINLIRNDELVSIDIKKSITSLEPELSPSNNKLISSQGYAVYTESPPVLNIPVNYKHSLNLWEINVIINKSDGSKVEENLVTDDLKYNYEMEEDEYTCIETQENKIVSFSHIAFYTLLLRSQDNRYSFSFLVLPNFKIEFKKELYFPLSKDHRKLYFKFISPKKIGYNFLNFRDIDYNSNYFNIVNNMDNSKLKVEIFSPKSSETKFPLTIEIPKIKVRLITSDGKIILPWIYRLTSLVLNKIQKHDKVLLDIYIPSEIFKKCKIKIGQLEKNKIIQNNKVQLNITQFIDHLRNGKPLEKIKLKLIHDSREIGYKPIINIRNRYEVNNLKIEQSDSQDKRKLNIAWEEGENYPRKTIQVWNLESKHKIICEEIKKGSNKFEIVENKEALKPGKYKIHIDYENDNWSSTSNTLETIDESINTINTTILGQYICQIKDCGYIAKDEDSFRKHLVNEHIKYLFPHLSYEELREFLNNKDLPERIYKCTWGDCNYYCKGQKDSGVNFTSDMIKHTQKCKYANYEKSPHFKPINDVNKIKKNLALNLPNQYKCRFCEKPFRKREQDIIIDHIMLNHRNKVLKLK